MIVRKLVFLAVTLVLAAVQAAWVNGGRTDPYDPGVYVAFDSNDGSGRVRTMRLKGAGTLKLPASLYSRPGYVFAGWCGACEDCEEGGDCWHRAREKVLVRGDYTYRAIWRKVWATRAANYCGYALNEDGSVGALVFVKAGRPSAKTGASALTATILQPGLKKITLKGRTETGVAALTNGRARLDLALTEETFAGTLNGHAVVGGPVPADVAGEFAFGAQEVASDLQGSWLSYPTAVPFTAVHGFWRLPVKGRLRLDRGELDACSQAVNPWGVSLKYNPSSGKFTGSFTVFKGMGGGVSLVAGAKCSVTGAMTAGGGIGWAVSKSGDVYLVHVQ